MKLFKSKNAQGPATSGMSRQKALNAIPVMNREVTAAQTKDGKFVIRYPVRVAPLFGKMALRLGLWNGKPVFRKLELDEMGSLTWQWIDGEKSVRELANLLAAAYSLHKREAEVSMTAFLRELGRRGIIGLKEPNGRIRP